MNILILTGKFGMGHYSASNSLCQQISSHFPNDKIIITDIFEYTLKSYAKAVYSAFSVIINCAKGLYNKFYKYTQNKQVKENQFFSSFFLGRLNSLLIETSADVVISTLPFCSQLVSQYKGSYRSGLPLITCITDISSHCEWLCENTDYYLAATSLLKQQLIKKGVPAAKIFVHGIPVKQEFKNMLPPQNTDEKKILIMGGGLGLMPKNPSFYEKLNALPNVKTTVIAGNNKHIFAMLYGKYKNIKVLGYTNEVYKYMQEADLVISKPGGITLFETIFSEKPMLVFKPTLPQEINNADFIVNQKIGIILDSSQKNWINSIEETINDEQTLNLLRLNIKKTKQQFDTSRLDNALQEMLYPFESESEVCA